MVKNICILGVGIDIVEIKRILAAYKRYGERFLNRIYTKSELDECFSKKIGTAECLAGKFALKEAVIKSLSMTKNATFKDIEILKWKSGGQFLKVELFGSVKSHAKKIGVKKFLASVSHSKNNAIGIVIALRG